MARNTRLSLTVLTWTMKVKYMFLSETRNQQLDFLLMVSTIDSLHQEALETIPFVLMMPGCHYSGCFIYVSISVSDPIIKKGGLGSH